MTSGMGNFVARAVVIVSLALVAIVLVGLVGYSVSRGADLNGPQIVGLLSSVTVLVGIIAALAQGLLTAASVQTVVKGQEQIQADVKNHIQQHLGHTDDEIQAMIDEGLRRRGLLPPPPPPGV